LTLRSHLRLSAPAAKELPSSFETQRPSLLRFAMHKALSIDRHMPESRSKSRQHDATHKI
ncbi:MAG: hypothetical protein J5729_06060, partial [Bacteroidaceae bacterium]|nr:hypothetical protein [Bacteroidaceae bacterium]